MSGILGLAETLAARLGGSAIAAPADETKAGDVLVGTVEELDLSGGSARFAVSTGEEGTVEPPNGWTIWFEGKVAGAGDDGRPGIKVLSRHPPPREIAKANPETNCVAIIATYNELDILPSVARQLEKQHAGVYVIDNWSTDGTFELGRELVSEGALIGIERFPDQPSPILDWGGLLERKAELAVELQADWAIHNDADEIRAAPWPDLTLRDGLAIASDLGFNAVDFTVVEHPYVGRAFSPGEDVVDAFPLFRFGQNQGHFRQIKAWRPDGALAEMRAGHNIMVPNRSVFPFNFLLRHYPIRSEEHGQQKVFSERLPRLDPEERAKGWHRHYARYKAGMSFAEDPSHLEEFDVAAFPYEYLGELIARVGLHKPNAAPPPMENDQQTGDER